jgi:hypothetical protein
LYAFRDPSKVAGWTPFGLQTPDIIWKWPNGSGTKPANGKLPNVSSHSHQLRTKTFMHLPARPGTVTTANPPRRTKRRDRPLRSYTLKDLLRLLLPVLLGQSRLLVVHPESSQVREVSNHCAIPALFNLLHLKIPKLIFAKQQNVSDVIDRTYYAPSTDQNDSICGIGEPSRMVIFSLGASRFLPFVLL